MNCSTCQRDTTGELTWPSESSNEICQDCWEAECSKSWWLLMQQLDAYGLLEAEPG